LSDWSSFARLRLRSSSIERAIDERARRFLEVGQRPE
jgi:hypothetical protein